MAFLSVSDLVNNKYLDRQAVYTDFYNLINDLKISDNVTYFSKKMMD